MTTTRRFTSASLALASVLLAACTPPGPPAAGVLALEPEVLREACPPGTIPEPAGPLWGSCTLLTRGDAERAATQAELIRRIQARASGALAD